MQRGSATRRGYDFHLNLSGFLKRCRAVGHGVGTCLCHVDVVIEVVARVEVADVLAAAHVAGGFQLSARLEKNPSASTLPGAEWMAIRLFLRFPG